MKLSTLKKLIKEEFLKEIKVDRHPLTTNEDMDALDILIGQFGEEHGHGGYDQFSLYEPQSETFELNNYSDDLDSDEYLAIGYLLNKPGTHVLNDFYGYTCPGAPSDALYTKVIIDRGDQSVTIQIPHLDNAWHNYYVGWFDTGGKYHSDTEHFDENGNMAN
jgi:hypothetical protein